jgi:hypothetical protein
MGFNPAVGLLARGAAGGSPSRDRRWFQWLIEHPSPLTVAGAASDLQALPAHRIPCYSLAGTVGIAALANHHIPVETFATRASEALCGLALSNSRACDQPRPNGTPSSRHWCDDEVTRSPEPLRSPSTRPFPCAQRHLPFHYSATLPRHSLLPRCPLRRARPQA